MDASMFGLPVCKLASYKSMTMISNLFVSPTLVLEKFVSLVRWINDVVCLLMVRPSSGVVDKVGVLVHV